MHRRSPVPSFAAWLIRSLGFGLCTCAAWADDGPLLRDVSFEDLANTVVTTVSRREEKIFTVPAATSVVTSDAVRRSGAGSLPEALRWVPGLNVAQISPDTWAVGARGFQWQFANKLLVMIDGRSVYSPSVGGVPWEDNPVFLENLAQVEVVRGPGASFWGANAVNGVIDIVTKDAFETIGALSFLQLGEHQQVMAGARFGLALGPHAAVRVFGEHDEDNAGLGPGPGYRRTFGGLRFDWEPSAVDLVTFEAGGNDRATDYAHSIPTLTSPTYQVTPTDPIHGHSWYARGRWRHRFDDGSELTTSAYVDHVLRSRPQFDEHLRTDNVEAVLNFAPRPVGRLSVGAGLRDIDGVMSTRLLSFDPERSRPRLFNAFISDEIVLVPDTVKLSLGTKVEHHSATGWNAQPSARLGWQASDTLFFWASAGSAVRTPTLSELTVSVDGAVYPPGVLDATLPAAVRILGNPDLKAERMTAFEGGVRWSPSHSWHADLAAFGYIYRDYVLATADGLRVQAAPAALIIQERFQNGLRGEAQGGELSIGWEPSARWQVTANWSYVAIQLHTQLSDPLGYERDEDTTPSSTASVVVNWQLGSRWQLQLAGRQVGAVPYYGIPAYAALDVTLGWQATPHLRLVLAGRNLGDPWHPEYDSAFNRGLVEIGRVVSLRAQWNY